MNWNLTSFSTLLVVKLFRPQGPTDRSFLPHSPYKEKQRFNLSQVVRSRCWCCSTTIHFRLIAATFLALQLSSAN